MGRARQRKLQARNNRLESLKNRTTSSVSLQDSKPKEKLVKNEVKKNVVVSEKRGRGRPPKSENIGKRQTSKTNRLSGSKEKK